MIILNIGELIYNRRKELKLTLEDVGNAVGVGKSTVKKWEDGYISNMRRDRIAKLAEVLQLNPVALIHGVSNGSDLIEESKQKANKFIIPVLGYVRAGVPIEAVEEILDYEEISEEMARRGEFFALKIKGDSMEPKFSEGDVVIVLKQETADNGDIAVVLVNGDEATVKKFQKTDKGIMLIASNPTYTPMFFTPEEVNNLPVRVIGKVVELRAKF